MARDTDVGGRSIGALWRAPLAGGRSLDGWLEKHTERLLKAAARTPVRLAITLREPHVVEALRVANLPDEEAT